MGRLWSGPRPVGPCMVSYPAIFRHNSLSTGLVLFSVRKDGKTYALYAIFCPYPGHVSSLQRLVGIAENANTGTNPYS